MQKIKIKLVFFVVIQICIIMISPSFAKTNKDIDNYKVIAESRQNQISPKTKYLFGYKANFIPIGTPLSPFFKYHQQRWQEIQNSYKPELFEIETTIMAVKHAQRWRVLLNHLKKVEKIETLKGINDFMNRVPGGDDQKLYKKEEYWATPEDFLKIWAGDCEDYAFAKYFALQYLDWPIETMWVILFYHRELKNFHAVLAVEFQEKIYVLDNLAKPRHKLFEEAQYKDIVLPLAALSHHGLWIFDKGVQEYAENYLEKH